MAYKNKETVLRNIGKYRFKSSRFDGWRDDKEVVLEAIRNRGSDDIIWLSDRLLNDEEVVMLTLKQDAHSFFYASDRLKNDRAFVLEAVKSKGLVLKYTSKSLQDDKEVVMEAVKNYQWSLEYASDRLKDDVEVINLALRTRDRFIFHLASKRIQELCRASGKDVLLTLETEIKRIEAEKLGKELADKDSIAKEKKLMVKI